MEPVGAVLELLRDLRSASTLESMLDAGVRTASRLLDVERVSIRLLDESRERLLVAARAGRSLHEVEVSFTVGEGLLGWIVERGEPLRIDAPERDARFVERPGRRAPIGSFLGVPLLDEFGCFGVFSASHENERAFSERHEQLAALVVGVMEPHVRAARMRRLSLIDPLTTALNRRGLDESLPRTRTSAESPCVLYIDIDRFKRINDEHGHAMGDRVLRAFADALLSVARHGDDVVRLGGEEFLLVLRGATLDAGARVAERAREAIAAVNIDGVRVTASIGVAVQRDGESRDALIDRADAAMYRAKQAGRDRIEVAD